MKYFRPALALFSLLLLSLACNLPFYISGKKPTAEPGERSQGELRFITEQATASEAGAAPIHGCWPSSYYDDGNGFLIINAGVLEGHCAWQSPSPENPDVTWNTEGTLSGTHNLMTGDVYFHFETEVVYPDSVTIRVVFDGSGKFTSSDHAEGIADYTSVCISPGKEKQCANIPGASENRRASWDIFGTVPWTIDFTP